MPDAPTDSAASTAEKSKRKAGRPFKITEAAISLAEALLARRFTKGRVKDLIREHYQVQYRQTLSPRTLETIIARARANMVERSGKPRDEHRNDAYDFYTSCLQAKDISEMARLKAQERIDKLLGLESPTRLEMTGKDGGAVQVDLRNVADADLEALERLAAAAVDPAAGIEPGGDPGGEGTAESA